MIKNYFLQSRNRKVRTAVKNFVKKSSKETIKLFIGKLSIFSVKKVINLQIDFLLINILLFVILCTIYKFIHEQSISCKFEVNRKSVNYS